MVFKFWSHYFFRDFFFGWNLILISVCIYGVKVIIKFWWEIGILKDPPPPLCTNGRSEYFMQLSDKNFIPILEIEKRENLEADKA